MSQPLVLAGILDNVFDLFATAMQKAANYVVKFCLDVIAHSPEPNLTSAWYKGEYHLMIQIGGYLSIAVALGAGITALLRGGLKDLLRTFLIGLPIAGIGGIVAVAMVTLLQKIDQDMTMAMLDHTQQYFDSFLKSLQGGSALERAKDYELALLELLVFLAILLCTIVLWLELVARQIMIYMSVLFVPLALAAFIWPAIRQWFVGLVEVIATMVFSKFVIASVMCFGFISLNYGIHDVSGDIGAAMAVLIGGLLTIIVACFAAPVLIMFVMAPSHDIISRKSVAASTPLGADNTAGRGLMRNAFSSARGGAGPTGSRVHGA